MLQKVFTLLFSGFVATTMALSKAMPGDIATYVPYHPKVDNSTYGNIDQIATTHYHVDWFVNWTSSELTGSIIHDMTVKDFVQYVQMDSWNLNIQAVALLPAGSALNATLHQGTVPVYNGTYLVWDIKSPNPGSGDVIVIELDQNYTAGSEISLQIFYSTSPSGNALTWLTPEQTSGKVWPYMYTQCEDINCRSVAPL